jgi:hypothetical protein
MFLVQKWDILKEKKQVMLGEAKERQKKRKHKKLWASYSQAKLVIS